MRKPLLAAVAALLMLGVMIVAQKTPMPVGALAQFVDGDGVACAGCFLYTYAAGSTTPINTYTTAGGGATNTNPIVLSAAGTANIWTTPGTSYRFDLYSAASVLIRSVDNVPGGTLAGNSTVAAHTFYMGPSSGSPASPAFRAAVYSDLPPITATTCTNQVLSAITTAILGTCHTIVGADFGASIAARSVFGRASATVGAPGFGTTVNALAYQTAEIPRAVAVASNFITSGSGTALEPITGLSLTIPVTTALNIPISCHFVYSQAVANVAVAFGIQDVTVSPSNIAAQAVMYTSATASTAGSVVALASTTATVIVSATPAATATNYIANIHAYVEAPSNASSSVVRFSVSTATAADLVTVYRGSFCQLN